MKAPVITAGPSDGMFVALGSRDLFAISKKKKQLSFFFFFYCRDAFFCIECAVGLLSKTSGLLGLAGLLSCRELSCRIWNVLLRGIFLSYCLDSDVCYLPCLL